MTRLTWSLLLCAAFGLQLLKAQNEPILSGSTQKSENITLKCDAIFVGKVSTKGSEVMMQPTKPYAGPLYNNIKVEVLQVLRGAVDKRTSVALFVSILHHESLHAVGSTYIFFVQKNTPGQPDPYTVLKLLPATDDNIAKVKALIAAAPASK